MFTKIVTKTHFSFETLLVHMIRKGAWVVSRPVLGWSPDRLIAFLQWKVSGAEQSKGRITRFFLSYNLGPPHGKPPIASIGKHVPSTQYRVRICKPFKEPKNRFLAWRSGTIQHYLTYRGPPGYRMAESFLWNRFLGSLRRLNVYKFGLQAQ
jgi:hypothetical protein